MFAESVRELDLLITSLIQLCFYIEISRLPVSPSRHGGGITVSGYGILRNNLIAPYLPSRHHLAVRYATSNSLLGPIERYRGPARLCAAVKSAAECSLLAPFFKRIYIKVLIAPILINSARYTMFLLIRMRYFLLLFPKKILAKFLNRCPIADKTAELSMKMKKKNKYICILFLNIF